MIYRIEKTIASGNDKKHSKEVLDYFQEWMEKEKQVI
jgi:hypothetical protein